MNCLIYLYDYVFKIKESILKICDFFNYLGFVVNWFEIFYKVIKFDN